MIRIFYSFLFLVTLFSVSFFVFEPANLYYELPWLDIPMHIFGGFGVGALALALISYRKQKPTLMKVVIFFLCIAFLWEVYELIRGVMGYDEFADYTDTFFDMINGLLGTWAAYVLDVKKEKKK